MAYVRRFKITGIIYVGTLVERARLDRSDFALKPWRNEGDKSRINYDEDRTPGILRLQEFVIA